MFDHIDYDPTSSTWFRFNQNVGVKIKAGMEAGSKKKKGSHSIPRIEITVGRVGYSGNRVAWEKIHGEPPPSCLWVVPLDGDSLNLSADNLQLMTKAQQRVYNSIAQGKGFGRVYKNKNGTARAYFIDRRNYCCKVEALGNFPSEEAAKEAFRRRQLQVFLQETN